MVEFMIKTSSKHFHPLLLNRTARWKEKNGDEREFSDYEICLPHHNIHEATPG
jgi:hypothetical protein